MRGMDERGDGLFSYVDLEARVPADHPLRAIRVLVDEALAALSADFARLYSKTGQALKLATLRYRQDDRHRHSAHRSSFQCNQ